jgi:YD repeat-containing protein
VHGNVTSGSDPDGTVTTYTYDACDRRIGGTITPGGGVASTTTFEQYSYDGLGRTVRAVNDSSTNTYTYDSMSRKLTDNQSGLTVTYTYDTVGNCLTMATPGGRTLSYTYDAGNLCRSTALTATSDGDATGVLATNRFLGGLPERSDLRNGTYTLWSYDGNTGVANASGDYGWCQIHQLQHLNTNGTVIDNLIFTFDQAQNKLTRTTIYGSLTNAVSYAYDNAERLTNTVVLTNSVLARNTTYFLDNAGNRNAVSGDNYPGGYALSGANFQKNQYSSSPLAGYTSYTYDANGSRLAEFTNAIEAKSYTYDYDDHPAGIVSYSGGGMVPLVVSNFSFEVNSFGMPNGAFLTNWPNFWTVYNPSNLYNAKSNYVGVLNAVGSPFLANFNGTTQGTNAAFVFVNTNIPGVLGLQQTLTNTLKANTQYTLNVDVGNPQAGVSVPGSTFGFNIFYNFTGFPGYRIDLLAGSTVIASDSTSIGRAIADGHFATATVGGQFRLVPRTRRPAADHPARQPAYRQRPRSGFRQRAAHRHDRARAVAAGQLSLTTRKAGRCRNPSMGGVTNVTRYVYDGEDVIEERNGANTVTASYTAWPDMEDPQGDTIVGESRINGTNYWGHADDQASMRAVTLDNGTVAERYDYQDYGEPSFVNAAGAAMTNSAVGMTWLYTGFKYDPASGFLRCRPRPRSAHRLLAAN